MPSTESPHWTARAARGMRRAIQVYREEGVGALWFKVLGETVYRRAILAERRLDEPSPDVAAPVPVVLGLLDAAQVEDYIALSPAVKVDAREILRRLQVGQWCFTARCDGRLVCVSWATTRRAWVEYLRREMPLAPDQVYSYEAFAAPDVRGMHIASMTLLAQLNYFRAAGYRRVVCIVMPENRRGLGFFQKLGYRSTGMLGYVRLGPWRRDFFHPAAGGGPNPDPRPLPSPLLKERENELSLPFREGSGLGLRAPDDPDWGETADRLKSNGHYLDPFLARLKKDAHVQLIARWGGAPRSGLTLKTDLFEEAVGADAFLHSVAEVDRTVGMDLSPAIAASAKERQAGAVYLAADARALPFAPNSFALILSPSTLDHFHVATDLDRGLDELARVLAPGGRLIITLDNRQNVTDPLLRLANRFGWLPYFVGHSLTIRELRAALESVGLAISDTTAILHNPRLFALGAKMLANKIGWRPLTAWVERGLVAAQKFGETRWRYYTGSFIAALAYKPEDPNAKPD